MPASTRVIPNGSYNHIGVDYVSARTASEKIVFLDAAISGNEKFRIAPATGAIEIDIINELTTDAGVTIELIRLKDGSIRMAGGIEHTNNNSFDIGGSSNNFRTVYATEFKSTNAVPLTIHAHSGQSVVIKDQTATYLTITGTGQIIPLNREAYSVSGYSTDRTLIASTATLGQLANAVATLIVDLKNRGLFL